MAIDKRINYRFGGAYQGGSGAPGSAEAPSRSTSKGTGGDSGNLGGGGGGQDSDYRRYKAPTKPTYTAETIDFKPVTGDDFRRSQNEFVDNLNQNNFLRAQQTNTPFVPYQGGARTTDYYNPNKQVLKGILNLAAGMTIPGLGFLLTQGGRLKDGIMSLNNKIQNSNFGKSTSLMDYLDMKKYGGYDEREMTRRINMDEAKLLQADIDSGMYDGMGVKPVQTFEFDSSKFNTEPSENTYTQGSISFHPGMNVAYGTGIEERIPENTSSFVSGSDVAPEFQDMIMQTSGTIGNYAQNAVSQQLYGKDYRVLDPFTQQQIDKLIEDVGTKSTGTLASGKDI